MLKFLKMMVVETLLVVTIMDETQVAEDVKADLAEEANPVLDGRSGGFGPRSESRSNDRAPREGGFSRGSAPRSESSDRAPRNERRSDSSAPRRSDSSAPRERRPRRS